MLPFALEFFFQPLQLLQTDSGVSDIHEQIDSSSKRSESSKDSRSPSSQSNISV